jgi:hypothetical protein
MSDAAELDKVSYMAISSDRSLSSHTLLWLIDRLSIPTLTSFTCLGINDDRRVNFLLQEGEKVVFLTVGLNRKYFLCGGVPIYIS